MKYLYAVLGLFFLISSTLFGQDDLPSVQTASILSQDISDYSTQVIGEHDGVIYLRPFESDNVPILQNLNKGRHQKVAIRKFSWSSNKIKKEITDLGQINEDYFYETMMFIGDKMYLFVSARNANSSVSLFAHEVDLESLSVSPDGKLLDTTASLSYFPKDEVIAVTERNNPHLQKHFQFAASPNGQLHAAYVAAPNLKNKDNIFERNVIVFDNDLNIISKRKLKTRFGFKAVRFYGAKLSNDGALYLFSKVHKTSKHDQPFAGWNLLCISESGETQTRRLEIPYPDDVHFSLNKNGEPILAIYNNGSKKNPDKLIYSRYSANKLAPLVVQESVLSGKLIEDKWQENANIVSVNKYLPKKTITTSNVMYFAMKIMDVLENDNEEKFILGWNAADHCGDLVIIKLNQSGKAIKIKKIPNYTYCSVSNIYTEITEDGFRMIFPSGHDMPMSSTAPKTKLKVAKPDVLNLVTVNRDLTYKIERITKNIDLNKEYRGEFVSHVSGGGIFISFGKFLNDKKNFDKREHGFTRISFD